MSTMPALPPAAVAAAPGTTDPLHILAAPNGPMPGREDKRDTRSEVTGTPGHFEAIFLLMTAPARGITPAGPTTQSEGAFAKSTKILTTGTPLPTRPPSSPVAREGTVAAQPTVATKPPDLPADTAGEASHPSSAASEAGFKDDATEALDSKTNLSSPVAKTPMNKGEEASVAQAPAATVPASFVRLVSPEKTTKTGSRQTSEAAVDVGKAAEDSPVPGSVTADPAGIVPVSSAVGLVESEKPTADVLAAQVAHVIVEQTGGGQAGRTDLRIQLQPAGLGIVQVHLSEQDRTITARLVVASETTQRLLESGWHDLRQRLADAGIRLVNFDVSQQGNGFRGQQQAPERGATPPEPEGIITRQG